MSIRLAYKTQYGQAFHGNSLDLLDKIIEDQKKKVTGEAEVKGSINLVMTSPPFALQRQKDYGNKNQDEYIEWLAEFAKKVRHVLTDDGSFVVDLGGAYQKGVPIRSLYNFKVLIKFCEELGFHLAEEFFWYNPSKLPSPIEWVNKRKIRAKDSVNTVWWFSKTEYPKADVRNVLVPYSDRMKKLLENPEKYYEAKERPSGHNISEGFGKDNGGAIPSNLLQIANAESNTKYLKMCQVVKEKGHPARFPAKLPEFFIEFLTEPGDTVLDIFGGSNTTGEVAERLKRKWICCDEKQEYVATSIFRFLDENKPFEHYYNQIMEGKTVDISEQLKIESKIKEAIEIISYFKLPKKYQNTQAAFVLLSLLNISKDKSWHEGSSTAKSLADIITFVIEKYNEKDESILNKDSLKSIINELKKSSIVIEDSPIKVFETKNNESTYLISNRALEIIQSYGTKKWEENVNTFVLETSKTVVNNRKLPVKCSDTKALNKIIKNPLYEAILYDFAGKYAKNASILYLGSKSEIAHINKEWFENIGICTDTLSNMFDIALQHSETNRLYLIKVLNSTRYFSAKQAKELQVMFERCELELICVSAFNEIADYKKYASKVAGGTKVWFADTPKHMMNIDGEDFIKRPQKALV